MPTCRACDSPIEVRWVVPIGSDNKELESLCGLCLFWTDVARQKGNVLPPNARRKPTRPKDEPV